MTRHQPESPADTLLRFDLPLSLLVTPGLLPSGRGDRPGSHEATTFAEGGRPTDLPYQLTRAYDLSITGAIEANIPIAGGGGFSAQRRVIVLERVGYDIRPTPDGGVEHTGFAIRLCVTVNKLDANVKLSLPFITASAQLGSTEAVWMLQIIGLTGPKIGAVEILPTELNVETFVLAKQSLQKLIEAIGDADSRLEAKVIAHQGPPTAIEVRYAAQILRTAALGAIARGWTALDAAGRYHWDTTQIPAQFADAYQDVASTTSLTERPSRSAIDLALRLLGNVAVGPR